MVWVDDAGRGGACRWEDIGVPQHTCWRIADDGGGEMGSSEWLLETGAQQSRWSGVPTAHDAATPASLTRSLGLAAGRAQGRNGEKALGHGR